MNKKKFQSFVTVTPGYKNCTLNILNQNSAKVIFLCLILDFKELVCLLSISTHGTIEEKLRWVFTVYDINNDGKLSLDEIGSIVRSMQSLTPNEKRLNDKQIREMFSRCDKNNDGTITVDEFVHASKSTPAFLKLITDNIQS